MRAAVLRGGNLAVEELPDPTPAPGQVLVAPLANGICGSDLHVVQLMRDRASGGADPSTFPPFVLGHEFCVEVLDYGPGTEATVPVGRRACSIPFVTPVGHDQPMVMGGHPSATGALAERMLLDADRLLPLPSEVPATHAALTEPLAVGIRAVRAAGRRQEGGPYVVIGCGPIGLAVILALRAEGMGPIVASDLSPTRRQLAERLGADVVVDPTVDSPYDRVSMLGFTEQGPSPLLLPGATPAGAVIFECVGAPSLLQGILTAAPRHSHVVVVGICMTEDRVTTMLANNKELSLDFVLTYRPEEFATSFQRIAEGHVDVDPLITSVIGLDATPKAFDLLAGGTEVKILIDPQV
jgi:threonine dehydrogenase-like Zn-dependent dehydrogenase